MLNDDSDRTAVDTRTSICFVIATIQTDRAGTEGHLLRLIRSLDRRQFRPLLVVLQRSEWTDTFRDSDIPLVVLDFESFLRPSSWTRIARLARILRQNRVRVVETHFPEAHFVGALAAKIAGVPAVIGNRRDLVSQYSSKERMLCRLSNYFTSIHLANANAVAEVASHIEGLKKFEIIYNGIDFNKLAGEPIQTENPHLGTNSLVTIVANLTPVKNIQMFIEAAARVAPQFDDVRFAIIGCGPEEDQLRAYAVSRSVNDRIIWAGRVFDVRPYLSKSIVGCLTSTSEGMSNSVLEYMAAGLPVIATRVGGIPEAVVHGVTGYLVDSGDVDDFALRLNEILSDPHKRHVMGEAGQRRAREHFCLTTQVKAHEQFYRSLAACARNAVSPVGGNV